MVAQLWQANYGGTIMIDKLLRHDYGHDYGKQTMVVLGFSAPHTKLARPPCWTAQGFCRLTPSLLRPLWTEVVQAKMPTLLSNLVLSAE